MKKLLLFILPLFVFCACSKKKSSYYDLSDNEWAIINEFNAENLKLDTLDIRLNNTVMDTPSSGTNYHTNGEILNEKNNFSLNLKLVSITDTFTIEPNKIQDSESTDYSDEIKNDANETKYVKFINQTVNVTYKYDFLNITNGKSLELVSNKSYFKIKEGNKVNHPSLEIANCNGQDLTFIAPSHLKQTFEKNGRTVRYNNNTITIFYTNNDDDKIYFCHTHNETVKNI
ncbi:MAG: hypothetical protein ACO3K7_01175 [Candidatus Marinamargulisbacteria bacterium]